MDDNTLQPSGGAGIPVSTPAVAVPVEAASAITPRQRRSISRATRIGVLMLVVVLCVAAYLRASAYGAKVLQSHPVDARIEISNPPAWLDRRIVNALLDEAYQFAQRDEATYNRTRDIMDGGILGEYANLYATQQAKGYNAWIRKVTNVRREVATDNGMQSIEIIALWRVPAAWVRVGGGEGGTMYLIDAEGTRLPGEYHAADRGNSPLMVVTGVELPAGGVPPAGDKWFAREGKVGEDLTAAMQLMEMLRGQKFAAQIGAIDMTNFGGRQDARSSWINLETVWAGTSGMPRMVAWGRPIGEEKYYEIQANAKVKTLKDLYAKFNRIDAGRDMVDIRTDVVRLSKAVLQANPPLPVRPVRG